MRSVVVPLILANIVIYLLQLFLGSWFTEMFMLVSADILLKPWTLITAIFLHSPASINHILFNMFGLFIFGPILESQIGPKRFLILYFGSGLIASIFATFFYTAALGASGAVMGVVGALIMLMPNLRILFFLIIPMPLWFAGIIWVGLDVFGIFFPSNVANMAHLAGIATGFGFGYYLKKKIKRGPKNLFSKQHLDETDVEELLKN